MTESTQLSQSTYERLQAEVDQLTTLGRVEVANRIQQARALGDLSENGDYHAAKDDQGKMEARIRHLQGILKTATIVDQASGDDVAAGSIVSLRYEGEDDVERFLVGSIEEKPEGVAVISPGSPLGSALLGQKVGDTVTYEAPSGPLKVEIVEIS